MSNPIFAAALMAIVAMLFLGGVALAGLDWMGDPSNDRQYQVDLYQCQLEAQSGFAFGETAVWLKHIKEEKQVRQCLRARGYTVTKKDNVYPAGWQGPVR